MHSSCNFELNGRFVVLLSHLLWAPPFQYFPIWPKKRKCHHVVTTWFVSSREETNDPWNWSDPSSGLLIGWPISYRCAAVREVLLHTSVTLWRLGFSAHEESFWKTVSKKKRKSIQLRKMTGPPEQGNTVEGWLTSICKVQFVNAHRLMPHHYT